MSDALRVLVVDDDADNAASLGEIFELDGHAVRVVHSGEAAISAYLHEDFDVAFMDVMMPGMNGLESFLEIRRMRPLAKVYMMTGYSVEELLQQAIVEGALGVLEKPFDPTEVLLLTASVGSGIVISNPSQRSPEAGAAIHQVLVSNGIPSRLISDRRQLAQSVQPEEVLVFDAHLPVIDGVSAYKQAHCGGHKAPTFIVPPVERAAADAGENLLRDVAITGILNKPFDPLDLLSRLPALAA